jgi:FkbM family methyltransferase
VELMKTLARSVAYGALGLCTGRRGVPRVIGNEPVRFPPRWFRYYPADYEPTTFSFLRAHCKAGDTALDIGAHIGLFSVVMARLVGPAGRVYSFEPAPATRRVLQDTVRMNGCSQVIEVRGEAVSRASGNAIFYDTGTVGSNANSLVQTQRSKQGMEVETISLDDFVSQRCLPVDCLKIDVEGAELDLLMGACHTFTSHRPAAALSVHPASLQQGGRTLRELWDVISEFGVRALHDSRRVDRGWFCDQSDLFDVELLPTA